MEIICHIVSSVDGRLLSSRWTEPANDISANNVISEYAKAGKLLHADAWMWGKNTLREVFDGVYSPSDNAESCCTEKVWKAARNSERLFIVIDPDANILFTDNSLRGDDILTVIPRYTPCDYLLKLRRQGISYLMVEDTSDLADVFAQIENEFGVKRISLQGGGIINGAALAQQVLTELSLVIYPGIDGKSGKPSIFEYIGSMENPAANQRMQLKEIKQLQYGAVWLRYDVEQNDVYGQLTQAYLPKPC